CNPLVFLYFQYDIKPICEFLDTWKSVFYLLGCLIFKLIYLSTANPHFVNREKDTQGQKGRAAL
ncbi:MAG TPA: hypothetical protein VFU58_03345, partial [Candidatus Nitrosotalea sp.]|nr:hypothetical protein [Candidatus Nitrosotalea sp.]